MNGWVRSCLIGWMSAGILCGQSLTAVTGTFKTPDGTALNGRVVTELDLPSVTDTCGTHQVITFRQVVTAIRAGVLDSLSLYPSNCLYRGAVAVPLPDAQIKAADGAGTMPTVAVTGQWYGTVTVTAGTAPVASATVVTVTMTVAPGLFCYVVANGDPALSSGVYWKILSGRTITFTAGLSALTAAATYVWNWGCVPPYKVSVYDSRNNLLYRGQWIVSASGPVDVTAIDATHLQ